MDKVAIMSVSIVLTRCCLQLTHLNWAESCKADDRDIGELLVATHLGWKELSLPDMDEFDELSFTALMKSVPTTLGVLKVGGWGNAQDFEFLNLLCSVPHLRRLEGVKDGKVRRHIGEVRRHIGEVTVWAYETYEEHTREEDRIDRTWALGPSMEYLQLKVDHIPRRDIVCRRNGVPFPSSSYVPERSKDGLLRYKAQRYVHT